MEDRQDRPVRIRLCTWNVGNAPPDPLYLPSWLLGLPVAGDLQSALKKTELPDVLVIGAQETFLSPVQHAEDHGGLHETFSMSASHESAPPGPRPPSPQPAPPTVQSSVSNPPSTQPKSKPNGGPRTGLSTRQRLRELAAKVGIVTASGKRARKINASSNLDRDDQSRSSGAFNQSRDWDSDSDSDLSTTISRSKHANYHEVDGMTALPGEAEDAYLPCGTRTDPIPVSEESDLGPKHLSPPSESCKLSLAPSTTLDTDGAPQRYHNENSGALPGNSRKNRSMYSFQNEKSKDLSDTQDSGTLPNERPPSSRLPSGNELSGELAQLRTRATNLRKRASFAGAVSMNGILVGTQSKRWTDNDARRSFRGLREGEHQSDCWDGTIERAIDGRLELVERVSLGQMRLAVYASGQVRDSIRECNASSIATGVGNVVANKGAICVSFQLDGRRLCFISAHLAAHQGSKYLKERNKSVVSIFRAFQGSDRIPIHVKFDHTFFMGDLNYRLSAPGGREDGEGSHRERWEEVVSEINAGSFWRLLELDELGEVNRRKTPLARFEEAPISFAPTFKVVRFARDQYIPERIPAYCDRILWHSNSDSSPIQAKKYCSIPDACSSDHKPVFGEFALWPDCPVRGDSLAGLAVVSFQEIRLHMPERSPFASRKRLLLQISVSEDAAGRRKPQTVVLQPEWSGPELTLALAAGSLDSLTVPADTLDRCRVIFVLYQETQRRSYAGSVGLGRAAGHAGHAAAPAAQADESTVLQSDHGGVASRRHEIRLACRLSVQH